MLDDALIAGLRWVYPPANATRSPLASISSRTNSA
jgi:hypothetical protein